VLKLLKKMESEESSNSTDPQQFILETFKAVTKGTRFDLFGLDMRAKKETAEREKAYQAIGKRKYEKRNNEDEVLDEELTLEDDFLDGYENGMETDGES